MSSSVENAVQTAIEGSRVVKVTFKEATDEIACLLAMEQAGIVSLPESDKANLKAVDRFGDWSYHPDRTTSVILADPSRAEWFARRMSYTLERIEAVG
jgi:hypothetical protein